MSEDRRLGVSVTADTSQLRELRAELELTRTKIRNLTDEMNSLSGRMVAHGSEGSAALRSALGLISTDVTRAKNEIASLGKTIAQLSNAPQLDWLNPSQVAGIRSRGADLANSLAGMSSGVKIAWDSAMASPAAIASGQARVRALATAAAAASSGVKIAWDGAFLSPYAVAAAQSRIASMAAASEKIAVAAYQTAAAEGLALEKRLGEEAVHARALVYAGIAADAAASAEQVELAFGRVGRGASEAAKGADAYTYAIRKAITAGDEIASGRRGQLVSTLGSAIRDTSPAIALPIIATGGIALVEHMTAKMAELAERTQNAAAAAGMSVESYSAFQKTLQLVDGSAEKTVTTLAMLGRRVEEALKNPVGPAADAFAKLGVSQQQLADGMRDPVALLDLLRARFQTLPQDLQRTAETSTAMGRSFREIIPWLRLTDQEFQILQQRVARAGAMFSTDAVKQFRDVREASGELSQSMEGLEKSIAQAAASTGLIDTLSAYVQWLRGAADATNEFANATRNIPEASDKIKARGFGIGGPSEGIYGKPGEQQYYMSPEGQMAPLPAPKPSNVALLPPPQSSEERARDFQAWAASGGKTHLPDAIESGVLQNLGVGSTRPKLPSGYDFDTTVLSAPSPAPGPLEKEFQDNLRLIEDKRKITEAEAARDVAIADKTEAEKYEIRKRAADKVKALAADEAALRQTYAQRIRQADDVDSPRVATKVSDTSGMQVRGLGDETKTIEARNAARRQSIQDQILEQRAELELTHNEDQRYVIRSKIASLEASITTAAHGHLIVAQQQAEEDRNALRIAQERLAAEERGADIQARTRILRIQQLADAGPNRGGITQREAISQEAAAQLEADYARIAALQTFQNRPNLPEAVATKGAEDEKLAWFKLEADAQTFGKRLADEGKRTAQAWAAPIVEAVNSIGSAMEKFVAQGIFRTSTFAQAKQQLLQSLGESVFQSTTGLMSKFAAQALGAQGGQSLGGFFGDKIASWFQVGGKNEQVTALEQNTQALQGLTQRISGGVGGPATTTASGAPNIMTTHEQAAQQVQTGGISLQNAAVGVGTAAAALGLAGSLMGRSGQALQVAAVVLGIAAAALQIAANWQMITATVKALIPGFAGGGIVPSAAAGMIASGGTLAVLHEQEMVLPAHISRGFQQIFAGAASQQIAPTFNANMFGRPFAPRTDTMAMLHGAGDLFEAHASNWLRNQNIRS